MSDWLNAEWVTAIAGVIALGAAFWAAIYAGRLFKVESDRDHRMESRAKREQASLVNAWWVTWGGPGGDRYGLLFRNSSTAPVFSLQVNSTSSGKTRAPLALAWLPPGEYVVENQKSDRTRAAPSGDSTQNKSSWGLAQSVEALPEPPHPMLRGREYTVGIEYMRDSVGNWWTRDTHGVLQERDAPTTG